MKLWILIYDHRLTSIPQFVNHGMLFFPILYTLGAGISGMFEIEEVRGGSPFGSGTYAGTDGKRNPTEIELRQAFHQGKCIAAISKKLKRDPQNYLHNIARRWWPMVVFWVLISVVMVVFFSTRQCFALSVVVSLHCTLVIDVCFFSSSECNEFLFCVSILMNMIAYFLKAKIFCVYKFCCITQAHSNPTHLINNVSLEEGCRDAPFPSALYLSKNRKKKIASPSWKHYHNQKKK